MAEAVLFALIASSALVIGGTLGAYWHAPTRITGILLAFASGSLIAALCFELFPEAYHLGGAYRAGLGLLAGGTVFVISNAALDRWMASDKADQREKVKEGAVGGIGFALLAAVTLDGVPENLALCVSLVEEAIAMRDEGRSPAFAIAIWAICAIILALAVVLGRAALAGVDEHILAVCLAFAGGAVLASLADTLMPEAFEHGKPWNSFATAGGFFVSFMLANA